MKGLAGPKLDAGGGDALMDWAGALHFPPTPPKRERKQPCRRGN